MAAKPDNASLTFEAMAKRKIELTPKVGFNVVGVDAFEHGADALFLVGHFDNRKEADAKLKEMQAEDDLDKFYIYEPDTE